MDILNEYGHWAWLSGGLILVALEALVPGAHIVWFGLAAVAVGLMTMLVDVPAPYEVLIFSVLSVVFVVAFRRWKANHPETDGLTSDGRPVNAHGAMYLGRHLTLATDIANGDGRVKTGDTTWRCSGPDMPAGSRVVVTGIEGTRLVVLPSDENAAEG